MSSKGQARIDKLSEEALRLRPELERYARRLTADNVSLSQDLLSDSIESMLESNADIESVERYLKTSVRNLYIDHIRQHERRNISLDAPRGISILGLDSLTASRYGEDEILDSVWKKQIREWVDKQLIEIEPRKAEAFRMYYQDDLTLQEIAQAQGVSISTAYRRIEDVKKKLLKAGVQWMEE